MSGSTRTWYSVMGRLCIAAGSVKCAVVHAKLITRLCDSNMDLRPPILHTSVEQMECVRNSKHAPTTSLRHDCIRTGGLGVVVYFSLSRGLRLSLSSTRATRTPCCDGNAIPGQPPRSGLFIFAEVCERTSRHTSAHSSFMKDAERKSNLFLTCLCMSCCWLRNSECVVCLSDLTSVAAYLLSPFIDFGRRA